MCIKFKVQVEPYFEYKISYFEDTLLFKHMNKVTSLYNYFNDKIWKNKLIKPYKVYMYFLHIHYIQGKSFLEARCKKTKNVKVLNQHLLFFRENSKDDQKCYSGVVKKIENIKERHEEMKEYIKKDIKHLKTDLHLQDFKSYEESAENISLCGLITHQKELKLAIASQVGEGNKVVYLKAKHLIGLVEDLTRATILQVHKQADRYLGQQEQKEKIAYFLKEEGKLIVCAGLKGQALESKEDITEKDEYRVDIDVLLCYYKIFKFEQQTKEEFEARLNNAMIYSNYKILGN